MQECPVVRALPELDRHQSHVFKTVYDAVALSPLRIEDGMMVLGLVMAQLCAEQVIASSSASRAACAVENALPEH